MEELFVEKYDVLRQTSEVLIKKKKTSTNQRSNFSVCICSVLVYAQEYICKNFRENRVVLQLHQGKKKKKARPEGCTFLVSLNISAKKDF